MTELKLPGAVRHAAEKGRVGQAGAALVEAALTLPLFVALLLAGLFLSYLLYARIALNLAVHETARVYAGRSALVGFGESWVNTFTDQKLVVHYGLNPDAIHALTLVVPLKGKQLPNRTPGGAPYFLEESRVLVTACYTLPFALPNFAAILPQPSLVDRVSSIRSLEEGMAAARATAAEVRNLAAQGKELTGDVDYLMKIYRDVRGSSMVLKAQAVEVITEEVFALIMGAWCGQDGNHAITAQAVVRVEPVLQAP